MNEPIQKYIILARSPAGDYEVWSDLKKICQTYGWAYNTISKKQLPYKTSDGWIIYRILA